MSARSYILVHWHIRVRPFDTWVHSGQRNPFTASYGANNRGPRHRRIESHRRSGRIAAALAGRAKRRGRRGRPRPRDADPEPGQGAGSPTTAVDAEKVAESLADRADDYVRSNPVAGGRPRRLVRRRGDPARHQVDASSMMEAARRHARRAVRGRVLRARRASCRCTCCACSRRALDAAGIALQSEIQSFLVTPATAAACRRGHVHRASGAESCCWPSRCRRTCAFRCSPPWWPRS